MNKSKWSIYVFAIVLFAACKQSENHSINTDELKAQINKLDSNYSHHIASQHADSVITLYKNEAVFMSPGESSTVGKENIKNWYLNAFDFGLRSLSYEIKELIADGTYVIESGRVKVGLTAPESDTLQYENYKYLHVWEKQENGKYLIVRKIWNNDVAEINNEE